MEKKTFCSKILLFGEYSIIKDSMGLSIVYPMFDGYLTFLSSNNNSIIDSELKTLSQYIEKMIEKNELLFDFDINSFKFDISQGLFFKSTIPQGFGVGSSGALCAAIYDRYYQGGKDENIYDLKRNLARLEAHFHGASSGLDPLTSYLNDSILIRGKDKLGKVTIPQYVTGRGGIFLLNTGRSRRTEPLVNLFLEKSNSSEFSKLCQEFLLPITNSCITLFLEGNKDLLYDSFRELSAFQFEHFNPMIPKLHNDIWCTGLNSRDFYLKLCGAGGGGFMLGMAMDLVKARTHLASYEIRPLFYF